MGFQKEQVNKLLLFLCTALMLFLTACDSGGKYAKFDDKKVLAEYRDCLYRDNSKMSPAKGVACNNYEKECKRRKENGNNICAL